MANLSTSYMGFNLKNPIIVGSSGLTNSVENIVEIERSGAAAVVLKSLFEEQINHMIAKTMHSNNGNFSYPEADDYITNYTRDNDIDNYIKLIRGAKEAVQIPVIASINCISSADWVSFAGKIEAAGADGLELNIFILPSDPKRDAAQNEAVYFEIIEKVKKEVTIPVAIKISSYFSGLANFTLKLSWTGINGMVLFNRFFSPDIDIDNFKVTATNVFSSPEELAMSLRWVAMLSSRLHCDVAASTGIHDGKAVIKQLLAGAKAVQIASILYKKDFSVIGNMLKDLESWMDKHGFESLDPVIGKMSIKEVENPAAFERVQFMKHFSGIE
ncbi:MAG: dihydroorotate dehydrogenase-like protein [Bacteroidales bacterium]|jgi:dihydroorotate dehydrogenase (fumarate)|nr:dihydroorotate dehydrogenase-like protein [Bacteroidales bacterium]